MTQTAKKSPFSMNVDLMHGPIFKNLLLFMLPISSPACSSSSITPWTP